MKAHRLNVTLPAHNEEEQLGASLRRVRACLDAQGWDWELVIAENGSTDQTAERAEAEIRAAGDATALRMRVERRPEPGRGRALRAAWLAGEADVLC